VIGDSVYNLAKGLCFYKFSDAYVHNSNLTDNFWSCDFPSISYKVQT
jgi:hypothetical protein